MWLLNPSNKNLPLPPTALNEQTLITLFTLINRVCTSPEENPESNYADMAE